MDGLQVKILLLNEFVINVIFSQYHHVRCYLIFWLKNQIDLLHSANVKECAHILLEL